MKKTEKRTLWMLLTLLLAATNLYAQQEVTEPSFALEPIEGAMHDTGLDLTTPSDADPAAIAIPNAFTPGQETNSLWLPKTKEVESMEVWIYNRQGLLVAHLVGLDVGWDGTHNGVACPQGGYVYHLEYRTKLHPDERRKRAGSILLIR
jgi:gliding motility-associated-like protein